MNDFVSYLITAGLLSLGLAVVFLGFFLVAFLIYYYYSDKDNNE